MAMIKTSDECILELIAYTVMKGDPLIQEDGPQEEYTFSAGWLPVSAARASFGKEDKTGDDKTADLKLMKFLADHRHVSCFEHNYATFLVECPLFVRSQIMRHKSFSFNEISRRYTSEQIEFWAPDKWRKQSKSNKQASTDEAVHEEIWVDTDGGREPLLLKTLPQDDYEDILHVCNQMYTELLHLGVCKEQARATLPQSLLTRFYMTGNLRSWWSFLTSRLKEDTQYETRVVAERISKQLWLLWPEAMAALFA